MNKKTIAIVTMLLTLLLPRTASAGSFFRYGVGVFGSAASSPTETKAFSVGYVDNAVGPFIQQYEVGAYVDHVEGRSSGGFGNYSLGVDVQPGWMILRSLWGVGAITNPDSMLGGWFQFNQDFLVGFKDKRDHVIGVNYKHISSAGIYSPNKGRDFLVVQVEIPW